MVPTTVADQGGDAAQAPAGQLGSTFAATLRSADPPQPAGGLSEQAQEPESAAVYPVMTTRASAVDLAVRDGAPVVAALRTVGVGKDGGCDRWLGDAGILVGRHADGRGGAHRGRVCSC